MKSFSNESLHFFWKKFCFSYILDLAKTVWAPRVLPQKFTINAATVISQRYIKYTLVHSSKLLAYLFHVRKPYLSHALLAYLFHAQWLVQSNIFTSTWFSSAQSSFITKFLVNFCDKIRRAHTILARSKM